MTKKLNGSFVIPDNDQTLCLVLTNGSAPPKLRHSERRSVLGVWGKKSPSQLLKMEEDASKTPPEVN